MLFYDTIESSTLELLKELQAIPHFENVRLVGGTSLALQYGHRISIDLDLFGDFITEEMEIAKALASLKEVNLLKKTPNIFVHIINGIKVDFVNYFYPWIDEMIIADGIRLASDRDIGAMKLSAITGRGSKKDFIDLYFLLQKFSFVELLKFYQKKYRDSSLFLVMRSLVYFDDADKQESPKMLMPVEWGEVKEFIRSKHRTYMSNL